MVPEAEENTWICGILLTQSETQVKVPYAGFLSAQGSLVRASLKDQLAKFLREKRGELTLKQFARKLGISDSTLQRLEIGEQNIIKIDTLAYTHMDLATRAWITDFGVLIVFRG